MVQPVKNNLVSGQGKVTRKSTLGRPSSSAVDSKKKQQISVPPVNATKRSQTKMRATFQ